MGKKLSEFQVKVVVDDKKVNKYLDRLIIRGDRVPLKRLAVIGVRSIARNFRSEGRPVKWDALKYRKGSILRKSGDMAKEVRHEILSVDNLRIVSAIGYGHFHQEGTRKNLAARPFMLWQEEDIVSMQKLLAKHLEGAN